jgi:hypothetical protein
MALPAYSGPRPLIQFINNFSQTVELLGRVIGPSQGRYLNTGQPKHRINAYTHQTSMPWVWFESTIPASERAKAVRALDRAAAVTGKTSCLAEENSPLPQTQKPYSLTHGAEPCKSLTALLNVFFVKNRYPSIWGYHCGGYEEHCLLGYNAV